MLGKTFVDKEMVRFFEQLKDCLLKSKELNSDYGKIFNCIEEAKKFSDAIKYTDCVNNSKYMYQFSECIDNKINCKLGSYSWPSDFKESFSKIDNDFLKLLEDLDVVLKDQNLLDQSTEVILKDPNVISVLNDISLLHCELLRYFEQIGFLVEIFNGLSYIGFLSGSIILTFMFLHWGGFSFLGLHRFL